MKIYTDISIFNALFGRCAIEFRRGFCYDSSMTNDKKTPEFDRLLTDEELALAIQRRKEGMNLHEIEGNPLTAEEVAMFEMFERERWSHEKCRAYIREKIERLISSSKK